MTKKRTYLFLCLLFLHSAFASCKKMDMYPKFNLSDSCSPYLKDTLKAGEDTVYVPFSYCYQTKVMHVYDCHSVVGRIRCGDELLSSCNYDRTDYWSFFSYEELTKKPMPGVFSTVIMLPAVALDGIWGSNRYDFYLQIPIPANTSPSNRTLELEYSIQESVASDSWSAWTYLTSLVQLGKTDCSY